MTNTQNAQSINRDQLIEEISQVIDNWDLDTTINYAYEQMQYNLEQEDDENLLRMWGEIYDD